MATVGGFQPSLGINMLGNLFGRSASFCVSGHTSSRARRPSVELFLDGAVYFLWNQAENLRPEAAAGDDARLDQAAQIAVRHA